MIPESQRLLGHKRPEPHSEIVVSDELKNGVEKLFAIVDERLEHQESGEPLFLFAAGRTSAGKSSAVTEQVINRYGREHVLVISMDDYFGGTDRMERMRRHIPEINWDHPAYINIPLVLKHLHSLQNGETIEKPHFNFKTGEPDEQTETISAKGKTIIVVEGIHALNEIFSQFNGVRAFVDISLHGSIIRRLQRDVTRTSLDPATILRYYLQKVEPMYKEFVAPGKERADVVLVNEYDPKFEAGKSGGYEKQVKFKSTLTPERVQKVAQHIASVDQIDYYFLPREGTMHDEIVRIRHENGRYFLTYKGPRLYEGVMMYRPKFEFILDEEIAKQLIEKEEYGPILKRIEKHRELFYKNGMVLSLDTVRSFDLREFHDLGQFVEVRFDGKEDQDVDEQIVALKKELGIVSDAITLPYSLME